MMRLWKCELNSGLFTAEYGGSITPRVTVRCCAKESPTKSKLQVGSPIIIVEAPKVIKTAASMPCLRANAGLVKPGDVGMSFFLCFHNPFSNLSTQFILIIIFIVNHVFLNLSRKPKDLWAVRLSIGTYLLDGKYFKALELVI
ncbi:hypothetical protein F2Q70_00012504 [Brassica cretica]|uniref:Uncharacterized protein n=1 Tax=Brassica cretica TaxID=69181 RepID=A0A8S9LUX0_BRACR|nr:hypothetical protein F2Q70_00012504 [Brassica cretica]